MNKNDINIGEFKRKLLIENNEDPAKDHFANAEDNLYKKVTGEEPKASTKNKFRDVKEGEESLEDKLYDLIDDAWMKATSNKSGYEEYTSQSTFSKIIIPQLIELMKK
jgi:hypothetical protein